MEGVYIFLPVILPGALVIGFVFELIMPGEVKAPATIGALLAFAAMFEEQMRLHGWPRRIDVLIIFVLTILTVVPLLLGTALAVFLRKRLK